MPGELDAEVAVIGVGTVGSMLVWQLARRGVPVIGFERHAPGHDRGAVGGETRLFRMAYAEGAQYGKLLRRALRYWRELESESGTALLVQCGGLAIGDLPGDYIDRLLANAGAAGVPVEVFDRRAAHDHYPQHLLWGGEVAVLDRQAGFLRCEPAVITAAETAEQRGATLLPHTRVDEVLERGDHVEVRAGDAVWRVRDAVLCAGSWTARFLPVAWQPHLRARRVPLTWFAARQPEEFTPARFPIFIRRTAAVEIYGAPSVDGVSVKVSSGVGSSPVDDPGHFERRHGHDEISEISQAVAELLPGLHRHPVRTDSFTDLYSSDGAPLVGRTAPGGRLLVAAGFSGLGFKYAPALAAVVADALVAGTEVPLDFMSPSRLSWPLSRDHQDTRAI